jgi:hypothetical protein
MQQQQTRAPTHAATITRSVPPSELDADEGVVITGAATVTSDVDILTTVVPRSAFAVEMLATIVAGVSAVDAVLAAVARLEVTSASKVMVVLLRVVTLEVTEQPLFIAAALLSQMPMDTAYAASQVTLRSPT